MIQPKALRRMHPFRALLALMAGASLQAAKPLPLLAQPQPASTAVVQEIMDGNALFIESHRARPGEQANSPEHIRSEASRAQLHFNTGASGRLNRYSLLRLGSTCFLLSRGEILVSGRQNACLRSARLSVRGTNYVVSLAESGEAEVKVLEGELQLEPVQAAGSASTSSRTVLAGQKARLAANGTMALLTALTLEEVRQLLAGPLFKDFRTPLAEQGPLNQSLRRLYPALFEETASAPEQTRRLSSGPPPDALMVSINEARQQVGRGPLQPLPEALSEINSTYLRPVLAGILQTGNCDHDLARWQALQAGTAAQQPLMPTSEVIACPRPTGNWNPDGIVRHWLTSPLHTDILLNRPRATHIGCERLDQQGRSVAVCTLWSPPRR
ncbi:MAG: hypothetical protein VKK62_02055 [Synechococcaceae cyanobacterium]|nr:hypothetical protein [Synechococcaceae cyanobacterium]